MQKSIAVLAVLAASLPVLAQQTISCSSTTARSRFCPANTKNGVILVRERSDNVCEQGSTWSYTRRGISVKGGCSADFQVGGASGSSANGSSAGGYGNNGYGNNGYGNNGANGSNGTNADNTQGGYRNNSNGQDSRNGGTSSNLGNPNNNPAYPNNNNQGYPNSNQGSNQGYPNNNQNNQNNQNGSPNGNNGGGNSQNGYSNNSYGNRGQAAAVIPSGTRMDVRLEQAVSGNEVNQGDILPGTLVNDVSVNGAVIAPTGTPVQAKVVSARGAPLDVRLDSMTVNGQTYKLTSNSIHSARDSQGAQSGNQTASQEIGSVLGSLTGGGAQLARGSVFTFRLTSSARGTRENQ